ncbi:TetR/AcrR family transcriptional regulator [Sedimentibacter sp.]|uniref:TetR/AcrR family transcriptional regulator n=1 Tax=Sedimentibacter sp. TaxID=1960295 RepID=UPI0028AF0EEB|nr:TetR/AcrR family transcriptional regulator [Sedimentibacter sp.]
MSEKYSNKKKELISIAGKLFVEKGYEETSVDDILKASGISKGGFYHYFKSKEDVLTDSIKNIIEELLEKLEPIVIDKQLNALEKLRVFMEKKSEFQNSNREYAKYLSMLLKSDFTLYKYYIIVAQKFVVPFGRIIEQGVKENIFDVKFPYETADILLRTVVSLPQSVYYHEYTHDQTKHSNYKISINEVLIRALGLDDMVKIL